MDPSASVKLIVIGAGSHAKEVSQYVADLSGSGVSVTLRAFVDEQRPAGRWRGAEVLGGFEALGDFLDRHRDAVFHYLTAVGQNAVRRRFVQRIRALERENVVPWTLVHPQAMVGDSVELGEGTCICPGAIVTADVRIGRHCIINVKASISHDCELGDYVNVNPGATVCGNVRLGEGCYLGAGATVIHKVSIGPWSVIGAGAVVVDDLPGYVTAVGVPARIIRQADRTE